MRATLVSLCALLFAAVAHAVSAGGNRLLVLLDDVAEKEGYSQLLGDLEGEHALLEERGV
jgi:dolichyl-diphosphooligosaccharide---protein glycosyltransferase subunit DDOST/WBP1